MDIKKGLDGVVVDETKISKVMPEINALTYHGYAVQDLAENCRFEEVAYLLWNTELPSKTQLDEFMKWERSEREISNLLMNHIRQFPKHAHPMDMIRTAISLFSLEDEETADNSLEANQRKAMRLFAKIPTMVAASYRLRSGLEPIAPNADLSYSENVFSMFFDEVPAEEVVKAFDVSMTLYAEHSFNASTFTTRVIASSLSDIYGATVGAIASLKGPLHGGANEAVMHMLEEVGSADQAKDWMLTALKEKRKIMGFGHRVYKKGDSRVPTMHKYYSQMAELKGQQNWLKISNILQDTMIAEKNIYPNLDFPAGPAYYLMGFDIDYFTPLFVMSRTTGWSAHFIEQLMNNKLIRPLSHYTGHEHRDLNEKVA